jgi:hypothetical protein
MAVDKEEGGAAAYHVVPCHFYATKSPSPFNRLNQQLTCLELKYSMVASSRRGPRDVWL